MKKFNEIGDPNDAKMPLSAKKYVLLLVGAAVILLGMILMSGGGSDSPDEFNLRHVFVAAHHAGADSGHRRFRIRNLRHSQTLVDDGYDRGHYLGHRAGGLPSSCPCRAAGTCKSPRRSWGVEIEQNLLFDVTLHAATVLSTIVVLWSEVARLLRGLFAAVQRGAGLRAETPAVDDSDRDRRLHAQRPARRPFWSRRRSCSWWGVCCW